MNFFSIQIRLLHDSIGILDNNSWMTGGEKYRTMIEFDLSFHRIDAFCAFVFGMFVERKMAAFILYEFQHCGHTLPPMYRVIFYILFGFVV